MNFEINKKKFQRNSVHDIFGYRQTNVSIVTLAYAQIHNYYNLAQNVWIITIKTRLFIGLQLHINNKARHSYMISIKFTTLLLKFNLIGFKFLNWIMHSILSSPILQFLCNLYDFHYRFFVAHSARKQWNCVFLI